MRYALLALLVVALVAAPALALTPTAQACEPRPYFCPFYGFMYGCWPGVVVDCAEEALRP